MTQRIDIFLAEGSCREAITPSVLFGECRCECFCMKLLKLLTETADRLTRSQESLLRKKRLRLSHGSICLHLENMRLPLGVLLFSSVRRTDARVCKWEL